MICKGALFLGINSNIPFISYFYFSKLDKGWDNNFNKYERLKSAFEPFLDLLRSQHLPIDNLDEHLTVQVYWDKTLQLRMYLSRQTF